jgi:AraC-like DNA-binding protein
MRLDETLFALARNLSAPAVVPWEAVWHVPPEQTGLTPHVMATYRIDRQVSVQLDGITPPEVYVVRVFLSAATIRLAVDGRTILDGAMAAGTVHVSLPGEALSMTLKGPCESLQWYLPASFVRDTACEMGCTEQLDSGSPGGIYRDSVIEHLARALLAVDAGPCLRDTAGHFAIPVLSRLFQLASAPSPATLDPVKLAIPRWRMQRVDTYIRQHLGDPISLAAVAAAAGLSPMHFAARFRLATGQRPHHYILQARIEHAKGLLMASGRSVVEVAGDAGFRTQAHFTTIFKLLTGTTPCAWRRERCLRDITVGADSSANGK